MSSSPPPTSSASAPTTSPSPPPPTSPPGSGAPPPSPPSSPPLSPPPPASGSPPPSNSPSPPVPSTSPPPSVSPSPPTTTPVVSPPPVSPATPPPPSVPSTPSTPSAPPPPSSGTQTPPSSQPPPSPTPSRSSPPPPAAKPPKSSPSSPSPPPPPPKNASAPTPPTPSNSSGGTAPNLPGPSPISITPPGSPSNHNTPGSDVPSRPMDRNPTDGGGVKPGLAVAIGLVAVLVIFSVVGLAVVCFMRKRRKPTAGYNAGFVMPSPFTSSIMSDSSMPRSPTAPLVHHHKSESTERMNSLSEAAMAGTSPWFSYEELYEITNGFSPQNILGEGGFGSVYKGCLPDGREVAVKRLKLGSGQGDREFKAEVEIISRVHHRHLVSLVGYCIADYQRLLVYDYVPNGTLESHLHGDRRPVMNWATRVKVAAGAARGIAYLHEDCHPRIIHRDIKSSNILLDTNFEAQVSDFGLARLALDACTHVTTRVMGTFGYLAPEYASSGKLTEKSDVFSFGVVLLEIITGRKPVDSTMPLGDESLVEWARPLLSGALETGELGELPDPRLEKNFDETEMFRMIEAAAACTRHSAAMRPQMGKVVRVLDSLADIDLSNGVTPGQSEVFNVAHSADIRIFQQLAFGSRGLSSDYSHSAWSREADA